MAATIYYFTGTGSSLAAARRLADRLGGGEPVPLAPLAGGPAVRPRGEVVGIVSPVYYFGLPGIVRRFAGRLDLGGADYVFALLTMGGLSGRAFFDLDAVLRSRGRGLDAGFSVRGLSNYLPWFTIPERDEVRRYVREADRAVDDAAEAVRARRRVDAREGLLARALWYLPHRHMASRVHGEDRWFSVDPSCTSCATCARVCPVGNISMEGGRPAWRHRCEQCLACLHLCPASAIQHGRGRTRGKRRFRHPEVSVEDVAAQRGLAAADGSAGGG